MTDRGENPSRPRFAEDEIPTKPNNESALSAILTADWKSCSPRQREAILRFAAQAAAGEREEISKAGVRMWQIESAVAFAVLAVVAALSGNRAIEWIGVGAVWLSFMHGQVSDRLVERQAALETPDVHCWRWSRLYFAGKELLWVAYFLAHHSYSALVGCALFLLYPIWRAWYRKRK